MPVQHPIKTNFSAGEWSPLLKGRIDLDKYSNAAETLNNVFILPQGGAQRRGGSKYIADAKAECRLVRFEFSVTEAYVLEFSDLNIRVYKDQAVVMDGGPVDIVTPYLLAELKDLHFTQSADTLYIVHKNHEPAKLTRTSDISWTITDIVFESPPFVPQNDTVKTITVSAVTGTSITLTASASEFASADVGTLFQFIEILAARFFLWRSGKSVSSGDYRYFGENLYKTSDTDTTGEDAPVHVEGTESDGTVDWEYVNSGFGTALVTGFTSDVILTADVIIEIPPGYLSPGYTKWAREQWTSTDGYPVTTAFFEERLWFAGSPKYPQRLWASIAGDFEDFTVGSLADDALEYTISSDQVNAIRWISPGKVLAIGTAGGEFILSASADNEAVTPTNIRIVRESNYGSFTIQPVRPSNTVLFLHRSARKLRELQYSFELDSYESPELSLLAEHIIDDGIVNMALQQDPQQIIHMVRNDGKLVSFTYLKEQEVNAWALQKIGGVSTAGGADAVIESIAILPADNAVYDEIWISVKRYVNSITLRHIEVIQPGLLLMDVVEDSYFVDAGVTYDGSPVTTISNLDHLEGETVSILADGAVIPDQTVVSGDITLAIAASKVHVGLSFLSEIFTLDLEAGANEGDTSQGKIKRINDLVIRLYRTVGLNVGDSSTNTDVIPFRDSSMDMDAPVPLFTGDKHVAFRSRNKRSAQVYIKQDQPLPMTVLALMPKVKANFR